MALIVGSGVSKEYGSVPKNASKFYITVPSTYLSEAYELLTGDKVIGEILNLKRNNEEIPEFKNKKIELIFKRGSIYDYLYISKKDWEASFREYGLVMPDYWLELKIDEAILNTGEKVKLYSKRDVKI